MRSLLSQALLTTVVALCLSGCQAGAVAERSTEQSFQRMWALYQQCRSVNDPAEVVTAAERLDELAMEEEGERRPAGRLLRAVIAPPPVRLAVDPRAMGAACLARADQMAATRGRVAVSEKLRAVPGQRVTVGLTGHKGMALGESSKNVE